jgi:hypothetical protein
MMDVYTIVVSINIHLFLSLVMSSLSGSSTPGLTFFVNVGKEPFSSGVTASALLSVLYTSHLPLIADRFIHSCAFARVLTYSKET